MLAAKNFWLGWVGMVPEYGFALLLGLALLCGLVAKQRPEWAALALGLGLGLGMIFCFVFCLTPKARGDPRAPRFSAQFSTVSTSGFAAAEFQAALA